MSEATKKLFLSKYFIIDFVFSDQERVSDYEIKLIDLDAEHLGIPVSITEKALSTSNNKAYIACCLLI